MLFSHTPVSIPHPHDTLPLQPMTRAPLDELPQHHLATQTPRSQPNDLVFAHSFPSNAARISSPLTEDPAGGGWPPTSPLFLPAGLHRAWSKAGLEHPGAAEQPPAGQAGGGSAAGLCPPLLGHRVLQHPWQEGPRPLHRQSGGVQGPGGNPWGKLGKARSCPRTQFRGAVCGERQRIPAH